MQFEMSERAQSVLRCRRCNKPFDKDSALKRHGYYCRSQGDDYLPRSRACFLCAKAKIRCDRKRPTCSRCRSKTLDCQYVAKVPNAVVSKDRHSSNPSLLVDERGGDGTLNHDGNTIPSQDLAAFGGDYFDWDLPIFDAPNHTFFHDLNARTGGPDEQSFIEASMAPSLTSPIIRNEQAGEHNVFDWSIPPVLTSNPRSLTKRPNPKTGMERTVMLVRHTLKSYVLTTLRHKSLPPFIHPSSVSAGFSTEPLENCLNLVHMLSGEMKGSRRLFWMNVRMECERLCNVDVDLNKWELLAAMQALSIYTIVRLEEGETEHNNCDSLLIGAVIAISQRLAEHDSASKYTLDGSWKDWLFEESRRRLSVIYRIINMLFYFEPGSNCRLPADLLLAPLPARKELWEADSELVWKSEREAKARPQVEFGLASTGDLVRLGEDRSEEVLVHTAITSQTPMRTSANWEEWCEGMDGFGGIVMLAASMAV